MRPYFAIIKDSFRAALASRVLYVLLLFITLLLLVISPLHIRETLDWQLPTRGLDNQKIAEMLVERQGQDGEAVMTRIWELLPDDNNFKERLIEIVEKGETAEVEPKTERRRGNRGGGRPEWTVDLETRQELIDGLNSVIENPKFYIASDWKNRLLRREAKELIDSGYDQLSDVQVKRVNRLLFSTAFSKKLVPPGEDSAIEICYAIWNPIDPLPMSQQQLSKLLITDLPWYFEKFVLSIGLLIAIIVTANLIPETFEPGSLNLLLSKPISRWGLYVAKFLGGCTFIGICTAYLFFGLWLWLGIGMGTWDRAILLSIPLYILVFAIYFAVSAFVGLVWRSSIVSVILTLVFWAFCFSIGSVYGVFDTKMKNTELASVFPAANEVFATDVLQQVYRWDQSGSVWNLVAGVNLPGDDQMAVNVSTYLAKLSEVPAFPALGNSPQPVYDPIHNFVVCSRINSLGGSSSNNKVSVLREGATESLELGKFPSGTIQLFSSPHGVIAATSGGEIYRMNSELVQQRLKVSNEAEEDASDDRDEIADDSSDENAISEAVESTEELFVEMGQAEGIRIRNKSSISYNRQLDEFAVYDAGFIKVFGLNDGSYDLKSELALKLSFDKKMTAMIAYSGKTIAVAFGNGKVISVNAETMVEENEFQLESRSAIRQIDGSPDGQYIGVLFRNGNLWMLDLEGGQKMRKVNFFGVKGISTFDLIEEGQVWIGEDIQSATLCDLGQGSVVKTLNPPSDFIQSLYRYAIRPAYTICPKPSEFYKVVSHLASSSDTSANENIDLRDAERRGKSPGESPWAPLTSGLFFMFVMIAAGCLVFQAKDY
ncbi:MAG: ABC transporter permease [Pirellulales bacterium]|jgi:ABC-type transport system involved in multi-copper enzyme maturation permease subunit